MNFITTLKDTLLHPMFFAQIMYTAITKAALIALVIVLGFAIIRFITYLAMRACESAELSSHIGAIIQKVIYYTGLAVIVINVAHLLGFDLSVLLGAAGVAGVAIGFASQTSMSNLISGIFLISENFIKVGDDIVCGPVEGKIESIDLFSVKVRTADGKLVRAPNELLIKRELTDVTYYPARRIQISVALPAEVPLEKIVATIDSVIRNNKYVAQHPRYTIEFQSISPHAQHVLVCPWATHATYVTMLNSLITELYAALHKDGLKPLYVTKNS